MRDELVQRQNRPADNRAAAGSVKTQASGDVADRRPLQTAPVRHHGSRHAGGEHVGGTYRQAIAGRRQ